MISIQQQHASITTLEYGITDTNLRLNPTVRQSGLWEHCQTYTVHIKVLGEGDRLVYSNRLFA